jgi:hypothetical protein
MEEYIKFSIFSCEKINNKAQIEFSEKQRELLNSRKMDEILLF